MLKVAKHIMLRNTKKRIDYELQLAESLADCLELCEGSEQTVVALFNKAYADAVRAQHRPKEAAGTLKKTMKSVSPVVRDLLAVHSPEEALELIKRAQAKVELRRRQGEIS